MTELHEILYCSTLAPDQPATVVGRIVAQARAHNAINGITGLLVFDGMRFCQHFEGPRDKVLDLMSRIDIDPRHLQIRVVYEGVLAQRRYERFEMGLAQSDENGESDDLVVIGRLDGAEALERFLALRPRFDIPGTAAH